MGKYFLLQIKRTLKTVPFALCAALVLFAALSAVLGGLLQMDSDKAENKKYRIGVCGTADDTLLEMGLSALRSFDDVRFSMELVTLDEAQADEALRAGEISAYVVFPEGFGEQATAGRILPIRYVTEAGASGVNALVKNEITAAIEDILVPTQKGVYGAYALLSEMGFEEAAARALDDLAYDYVALVLARAQSYSLTLLGVGNALSLTQYLQCALTVLLICLTGLSFAGVMIRSDRSLGRLLAARGVGAARQALCDFAAYLAALLVLFGAMTALLALLGIWAAALRDAAALLARSLPVIVLAAALSFFLYELADDLISGVLLQFTVLLALCFVSGCMYPVTFLPEAMQAAASYLPTGAAQRYFAQVLRAQTPTALVPMALYCAAFVLCAIACRARRNRNAGRCGA